MEFGVPIPDGPAAVGRFGSGGGSAPVFRWPRDPAGGPTARPGGAGPRPRGAPPPPPRGRRGRCGVGGGSFRGRCEARVGLFLPSPEGGGARAAPPPPPRGPRGGLRPPADVEQ